MLNHFWSSTAEEVLKKFNSTKEGLSEKEAKRRLKRHGPNILGKKKKFNSLKLFFRQLNSPLIYLLLFSATLSIILYDSTDAIIILAILALSTLLSFFQERGAHLAMDKLQQIVQIKACALREKQKKEIPIEDVVPGDVIWLAAGDIIPGDSLILESRDLHVDEATLTGESMYAEKQTGVVPLDTPLSKRTNSLFMGTHVVSGTALALVIKTGKNTEFGQLTSHLNMPEPKTEFERGVRRFGNLLLEVTLILLLVIFAANVYLQRPVIESLLFALALAVGLTPQLLPAIISINLAHGAKQMAEKKVIVKKLSSIENLGSMNILCTDKTGTLTTGKIALESTTNDKTRIYAGLNAFFQTGYNNAIDATLAKEVSQETTALWKKIDEIPYDFIRKRLSVLLTQNGNKLLITKGAFNQVLEVCTTAETDSGECVNIKIVESDLVHQYTEYCSQGFRVLAVCYKPENTIVEANMTFLGFILLSDPLKPNIQATIDHLRIAGINLKLITGDNQLVALHVANLLGITHEKVLTGNEIRHLSDEALKHIALKTIIFAEIEPNQKERIILSLQKTGNVVGYLGDGINDVTALHAADVSISVDSATDAAKEVANIVLLENELSVLQDGVLTGRRTFANTMKYVFMATSANFGNMFSMAGISLFLPFLPLLPKQVLLTNLLTDFPEMTIATDSVDPDIIEKPLRWNITFITKFMLIFGLISSIFDYTTFGLLLVYKATILEFRTGWFLESVISATLIVLVIRTSKPFFKSMPSPYLLITALLTVVTTIALPLTPLGLILGFTSLPQPLYLGIAGIVTLYICSVEIAKRFFLSIKNS